METMVVLPFLSSNLPNLNYDLAIIPTILIPLTGVSIILTSIATIIAGWFGIKLKMEGPKQLFEVLLSKKILISAVLLNLGIIGIYKGYIFVKNYPSAILTIKYKSSLNAIASQSIYENSIGRLHAFSLPDNLENNTKTLSLKAVWNLKLKSGPFRSGVVSGNSIFFGANDGQVHEVDISSGKVKRHFYIGTQVTTRPIIYNSHLYFGEGNHDTHHARIYSFDLKTGKFYGSFQTKGHTEGQPLIATFNNETLLFLTAGKDGLYAISPDTLKKKWHANNGHIDATVSIEDGIVYTASGKEKGNHSDRIYATAYEFSTGKKIWKKELPVSNWMHPLIGSTNICYVLGEIHFPSDIGLLSCLNKKTGASDFSISFEAPLTGKPLIIKTGTQELAVVSSNKGEICALNLQTRSKKWCTKTGTSVTRNSFSSVDYDKKRNLLWYASMDNGLFALDPESGRQLLRWLPANWNKTYGSVTIKDDSLYMGDIKGTIRKLDIK